MSIQKDIGVRSPHDWGMGDEHDACADKPAGLAQGNGPVSAVKTPEQVKAAFESEGRTFAQWAVENGYRPMQVYQVLNGLIKGKRGAGHDIAVKLGLKTEQGC